MAYRAARRLRKYISLCAARCRLSVSAVPDCAVTA